MESVKSSIFRAYRSVLTVYQSLVQDNWKRSPATPCHKQRVSSSIRRPEIKGRQISLCFKTTAVLLARERGSLSKLEKSFDCFARSFPVFIRVHSYFICRAPIVFSQFFITPPFFCFRLWFRACYEENN